MKLTRWTQFALPLAFVAFVATAIVEFRGLPDQVPIHFTADGVADRWLAPRPFIGLQIALAASLAGMLGLVRWVLTLPDYDPRGAFQRDPALRMHTIAALDLIGAAGILVVAWTGHLCAQASRMPEPAANRLLILMPLAAVLLAAAVSLWWLRRRPGTPGRQP